MYMVSGCKTTASSNTALIVLKPSTSNGRWLYERIYYNMGNLLIARNAEVAGSNPASVNEQYAQEN